MPRRKSNLHNRSSKAARRQQNIRDNRTRAQTAAINEEHRIRAAERRRQESQAQRDERLWKNVLRTRAVRQRNIDAFRAQERERQQRSRALRRESFVHLAFEHAPDIESLTTPPESLQSLIADASDDSKLCSRSITSLPLTPPHQKAKTPAQRQREYRLRRKQKIQNKPEEKKKTLGKRTEYQRQYRHKKKLEEAQNINGDKPAKKSSADYQREYRLRKKLKAELNSGSAEMISRQEARPSGYLVPVNTAQLMPSSPEKRIQWKEKINFVDLNAQDIVNDDNNVSALKVNKNAYPIALSTHENELQYSLAEDSVSSLENDVQTIWPYSVQHIETRKKFALSEKVQVTQTTFNAGKTTVSNFLQTESQLYNLTGVTSFELLDKIEKSMEKVDRIVKPCNNGFDLTARERIILTLVKLKTNMTFVCLAALFRISRASCYKYFCHTIVSLREAMSALIEWPEKQSEIVKNGPASLKNRTSTKVILNYVNIKIEKPKESRSMMLALSDSKRQNIVKYLIGRLPSGKVCFLSKSYGARVPDDDIFHDSQILEKIWKNENISSNRDFHVEEELRAQGIRRIRRGFELDKKDLSSKEILETLVIERQVEKAMKRIRIFKILRDPISRSLLSHLDSIMAILCGLANLIPVLTNDLFD